MAIQLLFCHLPPIIKTIQVRWTRHAGHCWRSKSKLISDILLWTPLHGLAKVGRPARTDVQQLCVNTGCSLEDLPWVMDDRNEWWERIREIHSSSMTWWYIYISMYIWWILPARKMDKGSVTSSVMFLYDEQDWPYCKQQSDNNGTGVSL